MFCLVVLVAVYWVVYWVVRKTRWWLQSNEWLVTTSNDTRLTKGKETDGPPLGPHYREYLLDFEYRACILRIRIYFRSIRTIEDQNIRF